MHKPGKSDKMTGAKPPNTPDRHDNARKRVTKVEDDRGHLAVYSRQHLIRVRITNPDSSIHQHAE